MNEKVKSYCVGLFNGDVKVFNSNHTEVLTVSNVHDDSQITDMLYFKSDVMNGAKLLVTCSELPNPTLVVSRLAQDKTGIEVIARAKDQFMEDAACGYTCMAQNPLTPEKFVSSSQIIEDADQGIQLWQIDPEAWATQQSSAASAPQKRQRTNVATMEPTASLRCANGVQSLSWASESVLIAGCTDHQLKVFDMERQSVQASVFTNHKVATALDSNFANEN